MKERISSVQPLWRACQRWSFRLVLVAMQVTLFCQSTFAALQLKVGAVSGTAGGTASVPIELFGSSSSKVVAAQFELVYQPVTIAATAALAGSSASAHGVNSAESTPGHRRIVIYSFNNAPFVDGALVNISFLISSNAPTGDRVLSITNVILASASAQRLEPVTVSGGTLAVLTGGSVRFTSVHFENSTALLQLSGSTGRSYVIQSSPDLKVWSTLSTNLAAGGLLQTTDTAASTVRQRFYRAFVLP